MQWIGVVVGRVGIVEFNVHRRTETPPPPHSNMRVAPLFETLDDLKNSAETVETLFTHPWYVRSTHPKHTNHSVCVCVCVLCSFLAGGMGCCRCVCACVHVRKALATVLRLNHHPPTKQNNPPSPPTTQVQGPHKREAGDHDRLFRLVQGRGPARRALGAVRGAGKNSKSKAGHTHHSILYLPVNPRLPSHSISARLLSVCGFGFFLGYVSPPCDGSPCALGAVRSLPAPP